jgi:hypothetical protein
MEIDEFIKFGKVQTIAMSYQICRDCHVVDTFSDRIRVGSLCPTCSVPSKGGRMFFDGAVLTIVDLMQEAYCAIPKPPEKNLFSYSPSERAHAAAVVVFFCTLKELLLERFLNMIMEAQSLPDRVQDRLNSDNRSHSQRLLKLFPSLVGDSWPNVLQSLQSTSTEKLNELDAFLAKISEVRNTFIHEGLDYRIDSAQALKCLQNILPMLALFVLMHNKFVHPHYLKTN